MSTDALRDSTRFTPPPTGPHDAADDRELVERVREGDRKAFEWIYRAYYRSLVGLVYGFLRSEAEAEEVVQELFLATWRRREQWTIQSTLRAYLFAGARNRALNRLKHEGIVTLTFEELLIDERPIAIGEGPPDLTEGLEAQELAAAARRAIANLPPRGLLAFTLRRGYGLSSAETAEVMGISEHTVKIHMGRALASLRLSLAGWLG